MMATIGSRKPNRNRNFLGEEPLFLRMVQEKEGGSSPSFPQTPASGGTIIPKEKSHTKAIISPM